MHVLILRTIMHNIVISFSTNVHAVKIVFVNTVLFQIKMLVKK